MTWSRVLVPTDLSIESERAADACLDLPGGPALVLVYVGEPAAGLEVEADRLRALGAAVETRTVARGERTIGNALLETTRDEGADLVVIGARGRGRALDRLLGSVSEAVLRGAGVDVLVVRGRRAAPLFAHVLVPTDLSPASVEAAERLKATGTVGEGTLLHVGPAPPVGLEPLAASLGWRGLSRTGPVVAGVIEAAHEEEATAIALCRVGGADAVAGIPLGRVAEGVAFAAPCPVLVAYPRASLTLAVRELDSSEFSLADTVWGDYHGISGDPAMDRVFALFADRTLGALARCRRHPDGCEVDAVFTPVPFRGKGYARHVMVGLIEACHNEDLYMYAVAGLERFYGAFGFIPIPQARLPPTIRARYDWAAGDMESARVTPMMRPAGWYGRDGRDHHRRPATSSAREPNV
ncbi:MAG: universal stress protein [Methanospirillum sp.]